MDYRSRNYTYIIRNQVERLQLPLFPVDDNIAEADETYNLTIVIVSAHSRVCLGENKTTTITIYDDDGKQLCIYVANNYNVYNSTCVLCFLMMPVIIKKYDVLLFILKIIMIILI